METIKTWTALVAATAMAAAVFLSLLPRGKLRGAFSFLSGVLVLCAALSLFSSFEKPDFDFLSAFSDMSQSAELYEKKSAQAALAVAKSGYENAVREALEKKSFSCRSVSVECNDEFELESVSVVLDGAFDKKEIEAVIREIYPDVKTEIKGENNEK